MSPVFTGARNLQINFPWSKQFLSLIHIQMCIRDRCVCNTDFFNRTKFECKIMYFRQFSASTYTWLSIKIYRLKTLVSVHHLLALNIFTPNTLISLLIYVDPHAEYPLQFVSAILNNVTGCQGICLVVQHRESYQQLHSSAISIILLRVDDKVEIEIYF